MPIDSRATTNATRSGKSSPLAPSSHAVHFISRSGTWSTPDFNLLDTEFRFEVDVAALPSNAKCARYFTPKQDGLAQTWTGTCWMNPPYGREITKWVRKAYESARAGATVVCLLPARTDTRWWHEYVTRASEVRFVRGRVKFGGSATGAPFPSAIVIFRPASPRPDLWARGVFMSHQPGHLTGDPATDAQVRASGSGSVSAGPAARRNTDED